MILLQKFISVNPCFFSIIFEKTFCFTYPFSKLDLWLFVGSSIWFKLEDLMQSHIRHPDVVLVINGNHVGQKEQISAPGVDCHSSAVKGDDGIIGNGVVAIQSIRVIPEQKTSLKLA